MIGQNIRAGGGGGGGSGYDNGSPVANTNSAGGGRRTLDQTRAETLGASKEKK
jgi:hypothetical protein